MLGAPAKIQVYVTPKWHDGLVARHSTSVVAWRSGWRDRHGSHVAGPMEDRAGEPFARVPTAWQDQGNPMAVPAEDQGGVPSPTASTPPAVALLADRANRTIVATLAEARGRALTAADVSDRSPLDVAPRLIRDRLRTLNRAGILSATEDDLTRGRSHAHWLLTDAGEDLNRLEPLIARIATRATGRTALVRSEYRDEVVEQTVSALADPTVRQIVRCLAEHGPLGPLELEALCLPTPRRTLYRRLAVLVEGGAVNRTTEGQVPRSTIYSLEDRWRPASAILLLASWWQARHSGAAGPIDAFDLEGLLLSVLPSIRVTGISERASLAWIVSGDASTASPVELRVVDGRLRIAAADADPAEPTPPATRSSGSPAAWSAALVNDRRSELTTVGDAGLADAVLTAVRSAILAYVR